jgi:hypothetical protein
VGSKYYIINQKLVQANELNSTVKTTAHRAAATGFASIINAAYPISSPELNFPLANTVANCFPSNEKQHSSQLTHSLSAAAAEAAAVDC